MNNITYLRKCYIPNKSRYIPCAYNTYYIKNDIATTEIQKIKYF